MHGQAQEDSITLPPPDEIFADGINVDKGLAVQTLNYQNPSPFQWQNGAWQAYAVPSDIPNLHPIPTTPPLFVEHGSQNRIWELDPTEGQLDLGESPCGDSGHHWYGGYLYDTYEFSLHYIEFDVMPTWVPVYADEIIYPCSMQSGEFGSSIDTRFDWTPQDVSPDAEWIVLTALDEIDGGTQLKYALYGFEIATGNTHFLGYIEYAGGVVRWLSDRQFRYWTSDRLGTWATSYNYTGLVDTPDSLEFAMSGNIASRAVFFDDPTRFEKVPRYSEGGPHQPPCILVMYDLETLSLHRYDIGNLCDYGLVIPNGDGDRLYINYEPRTISSLVRFNPFTGESETLYTGEVEWIHNISPDGRYALIGFDHSGQIELYPDPDYLAWPFMRFVERANPIVFDLETMQILYQFEGVQLADDYEDGLGDNVQWLNESQLLINYAERDDAIYTIQDTILEETLLNGNILAYLPEIDIVIIQHADSSISIHRIADSLTTPFIQAYDPETTRFRFGEVENQLIVDMSIQISHSDASHQLELSWQIEMP